MTSKFYLKARHWYHLSTTLKQLKVILTPRDNDEGFNRSESEPNDKRICVSPSIEHCLTAIPYSKWDKFTIYKTRDKVVAKCPIDVFDSKITKEGWITTRTVFNRIGFLNFKKCVDSVDGIAFKIKTESASHSDVLLSKETYDWWVKFDVTRFIEYD